MAAVSDKLSLYKFFGLSSVLSSSAEYLMWFGLGQKPTGSGAKECKVTFVNKFSCKLTKGFSSFLACRELPELLYLIMSKSTILDLEQDWMSSCSIHWSFWSLSKSIIRTLLLMTRALAPLSMSNIPSSGRLDFICTCFNYYKCSCVWYFINCRCFFASVCFYNVGLILFFLKLE